MPSTRGDISVARLNTVGGCGEFDDIFLTRESSMSRLQTSANLFISQWERRLARRKRDVTEEEFLFRSLESDFLTWGGNLLGYTWEHFYYTCSGRQLQNAVNAGWESTELSKSTVITGRLVLNDYIMNYYYSVFLITSLLRDGWMSFRLWIVLWHVVLPLRLRKERYLRNKQYLFDGY